MPALVEALLALDAELLTDGRPTELPSPPPWCEFSSWLQMMAELYAAVSPTLDPHSRTATRRFIAALRTVADTVSPRGLPTSSTEALWSVLATLRGEPSPVVLRRLGPRAADVEAIWAPLRSMLVDLEHVNLDVIEEALCAAAPRVVAARLLARGRRLSSTARGGQPALATAEYTGDGVMITLRSPSGDVASTFGRTAAGQRDRPVSLLLPPATGGTVVTTEPKPRERPTPEPVHESATEQVTLFDALGIGEVGAVPELSTRRAERRTAIRSVALAEAPQERPCDGLSADTRVWLRRLEKSPLWARLASASRVVVDLSTFVTTPPGASLPPSSRRALADVEFLLLDDGGAHVLVAVCLIDVATDGRVRRATSALRPVVDSWRQALQAALGVATLHAELWFPLCPWTVRL